MQVVKVNKRNLPQRKKYYQKGRKGGRSKAEATTYGSQSSQDLDHSRTAGGLILDEGTIYYPEN